MTRQIEELYEAIICKRWEDPDSGRTARLVASGRKKIGKKLGEEAFEKGEGAGLIPSVTAAHHFKTRRAS